MNKKILLILLTVIVGISLISGIFIAVDNPFKSSGSTVSPVPSVTPVPTVAPRPTVAPTPDCSSLTPDTVIPCKTDADSQMCIKYGTDCGKTDLGSYCDTSKQSCHWKWSTPTPAPTPAPTSCDSTTCKNEGTCIAGSCSCAMGWKGPDCNISKCNLECNANAECGDEGICVCKPAWTGERCDKCAKCNTDNGTCESNGSCTCNTGWTGEDCTEPVCNNCSSSGGECSAPNVCRCKPGWGSPDCSVSLKTPQCMPLNNTPGATIKYLQIYDNTPSCYCGADTEPCTTSTVAGTNTWCGSRCLDFNNGTFYNRFAPYTETGPPPTS